MNFYKTSHFDSLVVYLGVFCLPASLKCVDALNRVRIMICETNSVCFSWVVLKIVTTLYAALEWCWRCHFCDSLPWQQWLFGHLVDVAIFSSKLYNYSQQNTYCYTGWHLLTVMNRGLDLFWAAYLYDTNICKAVIDNLQAETKLARD